MAVGRYVTAVRVPRGRGSCRGGPGGRRIGRRWVGVTAQQRVGPVAVRICEGSVPAAIARGIRGGRPVTRELLGRGQVRRRRAGTARGGGAPSLPVRPAVGGRDPRK